MTAEREEIEVAFPGEDKFKPYSKVELEYFKARSAATDEQESESPWAESMFAIQERLEEGSILALHEVISLSYEQQLPLPVWANEELQRLIGCLANGEPYAKGVVGRSNNPAAKVREAIKGYFRFDTVRRIRWYQQLGRCHFSYMLLPACAKILKLDGAFPDFGSRLEDAISHAAICLRGTFAQASVETVRKNYFSDNQDGAFWAMTRPDALKIVGVPEDLFDIAGIFDVPTIKLDTPSQVMSGEAFEIDALSQIFMQFCYEHSFDELLEMISEKRHAEIPGFAELASGTDGVRLNPMATHWRAIRVTPLPD